MSETKQNLENPSNAAQQPQKPETDDWYTQALEELDDFIESQGIYIRQ